MAGFLTLNSTENVLYVPKNKQYYIHNISFTDIHNFIFKIDGNLIASKQIDTWPHNNEKYFDIFNFDYSSNLKFTGSGEIQGNGYGWWLGTFLNLNHLWKMDRPHMFWMEHSSNILFEGLTLRNSAYFHIGMKFITNLTVRNMKIWVDIEAQKELYIKHGNLTENDFLPLNSSLTQSFPVFPLNTDGIDPHGKGFHFYNIEIKNYDDAIAVKPSFKDGWGCTEDIIAENFTIINSVGMSIGSVPSREGCNCIRNVIIRNIKFLYPFKGIYIKTNSGDQIGTGLIQNITYANLFMNTTLWYPIYIGPQQQKQPDGGGDGWWPPTNPRVTILDIFITNVTSINGIFPFRGAGVIRCNASNPCRNFIFNNISIEGVATQNYVCNSTFGVCNNCKPFPNCFQQEKKQADIEYFLSKEQEAQQNMTIQTSNPQIKMK